MSIDLDAIERLARAATPGPWRVSGDVVYGNGAAILRSSLPAGWLEREANASFIAAASPDIVLALIAMARGAKREIET